MDDSYKLYKCFTITTNLRTYRVYVLSEDDAHAEAEALKLNGETVIRVKGAAWTRVNGSAMRLAVASDGALALDIEGVHAPLRAMDRGGVALVAQWINAARPTTEVVWRVIHEIPHALRVGLLDALDDDVLEGADGG